MGFLNSKNTHIISEITHSITVLYQSYYEKSQLNRWCDYKGGRPYPPGRAVRLLLVLFGSFTQDSGTWDVTEMRALTELVLDLADVELAELIAAHRLSVI